MKSTNNFQYPQTLVVLFFTALLALLIWSPLSCSAAHAQEQKEKKGKSAKQTRPAEKPQANRAEPDPARAIYFRLDTNLGDELQFTLEEKLLKLAEPTLIEVGDVTFVREGDRIPPGKKVYVLDFNSRLTPTGRQQLDSTGKAIGAVIWDETTSAAQSEASRLPGRAGGAASRILGTIFGDLKQDSGLNGQFYRQFYRVNATVKRGDKQPVRVMYFWGVRNTYKGRERTPCYLVDRFARTSDKVQDAKWHAEGVVENCVDYDAAYNTMQRETFDFAVSDAWLMTWLDEIKVELEARPKSQSDTQADVTTTSGGVKNSTSSNNSSNSGLWSQVEAKLEQFRKNPELSAVKPTPTPTPTLIPVPTPKPTPIAAPTTTVVITPAPPAGSFQEIFFDGKTTMSGPNVEKVAAFLVNKKYLGWNPAWRGINWGLNATNAWKQVEVALKAAKLPGAVEDGRVNKAEWDWLNTQPASLFKLTPEMLASKAKAAPASR